MYIYTKYVLIQPRRRGISHYRSMITKMKKKIKQFNQAQFIELLNELKNDEEYCKL